MKMDFFIKEIRNKLSLCYLNADKTEIITYCPYCEGITGKRHGHLYISTMKPVFICHRCGKKGMVIDFLKEIKLDLKLEDIYEKSVINKRCVSIIEEFDLVNNGSFSNNNVKDLEEDRGELSRDRIVFNLSKDIIDKKISFLVNRIGISYDSIFSIPGLVLRPSSFIFDLGLSLKYIKFLDMKYIGFLSDEKKYIYLRSIDDNVERKHLLFRIRKDIHKDYYTIKKRDIDLDIPVLVLSEGVFDVIVPYMNDIHEKVLDGMRVNFVRCVFGKGNYLNGIKDFILRYFVPRLDVVIFSDLDFSVADLGYKIKCLPMVRRFYVVYNKKYKDFGNINHSFIDDIVVYRVK